MSEADEDDLLTMFGKPTKRQTGAAGRRARELKTIPASAQRALRAQPTKTVQLNIKVTEAFKARVVSMAVARGISQAELIELAIEKLGDS